MQFAPRDQPVANEQFHRIIDTPIWGKIPTGGMGGGQNAPIDPEERAKMATPLGRAGHAEEIAQGVLYLASDAARGVNGACLTISGGEV
mgnify:CR=1 FL=1